MTSASKKLIFVICRSTFAGDEGRDCTEFKQAKNPFKWKKYVCIRCGALRTEHRAGKAQPDDAEVIRREEDLPPRKRLMLRFERFQAFAAAAAAAAKEQEKGEGEIWSADATIARGKRSAPRRKRGDAP